MPEKIISVEKSKTVDYGDKQITDFWFKTDGVKPLVTGEVDCSDKIKTLLESLYKAVICVYSENLTDANLINFLFDAAENNRVYILTNEYNNEIEPLKGRCLIRYGFKSIGSFVLANSNTETASGVFFMNKNLCLDIDSEQNEILYRHFCRHFWNSATKEIIDSGEKTLDTGNPPVDVFHCKNNFCDTEYVKKQIQGPDAKIISPLVINSSYFDFQEISNSEIITTLNTNPELLYSVKQNNNSIYAVSNDINLNIISNSNGLYIIPNPTVSRDTVFMHLKQMMSKNNKLKLSLRNIKTPPLMNFLIRNSAKIWRVEQYGLLTAKNTTWNRIL